MTPLSAEEKDYIIHLGKRIKELRLSKGITQKELSYRIDIERSSLARVELGRTNPTIITIKRIAKELNVDMAELIPSTL